MKWLYLVTMLLYGVVMYRIGYDNAKREIEGEIKEDFDLTDDLGDELLEDKKEDK